MEVSESLCAMDFLLGHQGFTVELLNVSAIQQQLIALVECLV